MNSLTFIFFVDPREDNNAERIFKIMPERNAHSYCTMIRGMVKVKLPFSARRIFFQLVKSHTVIEIVFVGFLFFAAWGFC